VTAVTNLLFDTPPFFGRPAKCEVAHAARSARHRAICEPITFSERNEIRPPDDGGLIVISDCVLSGDYRSGVSFEAKS